MQKLIGHLEGTLTKRFYFVGMLEIPCPKCGGSMIKDFSENYLIYPTIGVEDKFGIYCHICDDECEIPFIIKSVEVQIEYGDPKPFS